MGAPPDFSRRIPQLDGLRGVAIAMVVAYHYAGFAAEMGAPAFVKLVLTPTNLGWAGVDLFFVLSGFLIGGILIDARGSSNYFRAFYRRRICRILPLYLAFLGLVFLISRGTPSLAPWWTCMTFCQNFWMAAHKAVGSAGVGITWSLAIEEQFYLLLPALIYFVRPSRLPWVLAGGIIAAPLIRLGIFFGGHHLTPAMHVLLPCRMDSLLLGAATAYFLRQPGAWEFVRSHRRGLWIAIEILSACCALVFLQSSYVPMMLVGYDCLALLYSCILVASLVDESLVSLLRAKWLKSLGGIAYCVYLIHCIVFDRVRVFTGQYPHAVVTTEIAALMLTILIAKISWSCFEKPFINLGHRANYSEKGEGTVSTAGTQPALEGAQP